MTGEAGRAIREPRATRRDIRRTNQALVRALPLPDGLGNLKSIKRNTAPLGGSPAARCCAKCIKCLAERSPVAGLTFWGGYECALNRVPSELEIKRCSHERRARRWKAIS